MTTHELNKKIYISVSASPSPQLLDKKFAMAAFTLVNDLLLCQDYMVHICLTCKDNLSNYFSKFLRDEKKIIQGNGIKFNGINRFGTPELNLECTKLADFECGILITRFLDRKLKYVEMMTEKVRQSIEKGESVIEDYRPIDWMAMLGQRPSVRHADGKPGALIR